MIECRSDTCGPIQLKEKKTPEQFDWISAEQARFGDDAGIASYRRLPAACE
jgi:hypothetical protein